METITVQTIADVLPAWYRENRRELPWRQTKDPYAVWISEIMLQQTRVEAVRGYYTRFLEALPTVQSLARCEDDRLMKLWEGLGYYSRARNLKKAAQKIVSDFGGNFPRTFEEVISLPGIGEYTAGAICSICFDLPTPAVDGNVLRLYSRILDDHTPIDDPRQKQKVREFFARNYPAAAGEFTQALMELGATLCGPNRKPECESCPCNAFCLGYARGTAQQLPVKAPKKSRREEEMTVLILRCDGCYALEKRPETGLLAGLWQFPNVPGTLSETQALQFLEQKGIHPRDLRRKLEKKHIFTHVQWNMTGYYIDIAQMPEAYVWMPHSQVEAQTALPTAFRQFWEAEKDV